MSELVIRNIRCALSDALADTRAVILSGARQVGKSTIAKAETRDFPNVEVRRLDRPTELEAARRDPESFVRHDGLLVVDEIQRAPGLLVSIKAAVDADDRPGQFLLTGSARLLGLRHLPDSLIGRSETLELWPFSQGELTATVEQFIDHAFAERPFPRFSSELTRSEYVEKALVGGYPEAVKRTPERRAKFFAAYLDDLIDRDITQLSEIQRRPDLVRMLALLAGRMATPISIQNVAEALVVPAKTVERYVALLEEVYLVKRLNGWATTSTKRATQRDKLIFVDSGIAAHLAGFSRASLERSEAAVGLLLENFVIGEVWRQLGWAKVAARPYHFRDREGREIDILLEGRDGRVVAIEVKSGATVRGEDVRHLAYLRDALGARFHRGILLHTGTDTREFGDRIVVAPLSTLWSG